MRQRGIAAYGGTRHPHHARGARLARPCRAGGGAFGPSREPETVDLANHRIAGDAAEFGCNLACRKAIRPKFFQKFYPLVGPTHVIPPRPIPLRIRPRCLAAHGSPDPQAVKAKETF